MTGQIGLAYPVPVDFDGQLLRWKIASSDDPVVYDVINDSTLDDTDANSYVAAAADIWSDVPGSKLKLMESADRPGIQPMVTLYFQSSFDGGSFSAAYAVFDEYDDDDSPVHCSVKIAVRGGESSNDLKKTILHELGHCLGLGHSLFPKAIMSYRLEENSFGLDIDDQAALVRLYPEDDSVAELPAGCALRQPRRSNNSQDQGFDLTLWVLPVLVFLSGSLRAAFQRPGPRSINFPTQNNNQHH